MEQHTYTQTEVIGMLTTTVGDRYYLVEKGNKQNTWIVMPYEDRFGQLLGVPAQIGDTYKTLYAENRILETHLPTIEYYPTPKYVLVNTKDT